MSEWWTYRPSDLLMFAPRTYWRLFELHNESLWPMQVLTALLAFAFALYIVGKALLFGDPVAGWPTMMTVILFLLELFMASIRSRESIRGCTRRWLPSPLMRIRMMPRIRRCGWGRWW